MRWRDTMSEPRTGPSRAEAYWSNYPMRNVVECTKIADVADTVSMERSTQRHNSVKLLYSAAGAYAVAIMGEHAGFTSETDALSQRLHARDRLKKVLSKVSDHSMCSPAIETAIVDFERFCRLDLSRDNSMLKETLLKARDTTLLR